VKTRKRNGQGCPHCHRPWPRVWLVEIVDSDGNARVFTHDGQAVVMHTRDHAERVVAAMARETGAMIFRVVEAEVYS